MEGDLKGEIAEIEARWAQVASQIEETTITAYKKDIREDLLGLAWVPYWYVKIDSQEQELPGYKAE